jgi:O-methyltransferase
MEQIKAIPSNREIDIWSDYRDQSWYSYHINKLYVRFIRPHISQEINQQRLKLIYNIWGYRSILFIGNILLVDRLRLIARFISIDWNVVHAHIPFEIVSVCQYLSDRPACNDEIMVEAGCWNGGSSAKFSIICKILGYKLHIYDSFEGVEELTPEEKKIGYDFSGEYKAPETLLRRNLMHFGEISVCSIHKGWFKETIAVNHLTKPVRVAFIDCDTAKGTYEVLTGLMPALVEDGCIFTQDFHIRPVRELLYNPDTWKEFGRGKPTITQLGAAWPSGALALLRFIKK